MGLLSSAPTPDTARNPQLLYMWMRDAWTEQRAVNKRLDDLAASAGTVSKSAPQLSIEQIRSALQLRGSTPLNVTGLLGVLSQPQAAAPQLAASLSLLPPASALGLGTLGITTGAPAAIYFVANSGSGVHTWTQVSTVPANMVTTDTAQSITGIKTLTSGEIDLAGPDAGADQILFKNAALVQQWTIYQLLGIAGQQGSFRLQDSVAILDMLAIAPATGAATLRGKITGYDQMATAGEGVPVIVASVDRLAQAALIASTSLFTPGPGNYRLSYVITPTASGAGTATFSYGFTGDAGATGVTRAAVPLTGIGINESFYIHAVAGLDITYSVAYAAPGTYALHVTLERLS